MTLSNWKPTDEMEQVAWTAWHESIDGLGVRHDLAAVLIAVQPIIVAEAALEIKRLRESLRQITQFKLQLNEDRDYGQKTNFASAIIIAEMALARP